MAMNATNTGSIIAKLITAGLLFAALAKHPYDYYIVLRWITCGVAIFALYQAADKKKFGWLIVFLIVAVVLNPIVPVHLKRQTWEVIDCVAAVVLLLSIPIMDFRKPQA